MQVEMYKLKNLNKRDIHFAGKLKASLRTENFIYICSDETPAIRVIKIDDLKLAKKIKLDCYATQMYSFKDSGDNKILVVGNSFGMMIIDEKTFNIEVEDKHAFGFDSRFIQLRSDEFTFIGQAGEERII